MRAEAQPAEAAEPRVESVEHDGPPGSTSSGPGAWISPDCRSTSSSTRWTTRTSSPAISGRQIDEYPDYLFIVLDFPVVDKTVGRLNAAELDIFIGPDFLITLPNAPLSPVEYLFERCVASEETREGRMSKGAGWRACVFLDRWIRQASGLGHRCDSRGIARGSSPRRDFRPR